ncbi:hypothetical protein FKG96_19815 [Olivibacter sp. LS-1]|uniref:hypothetical protein n=1 Tax=Olivibacter sp. LS-1 TaxID=2592345 RepID=UPI0011EAC5BF|nr:hypothetical protein [Olivibacter sp. LS-1]QEL02973.1 hypothetical protein FKG96_19815 [Olivibacter sp. LS-1]
MKRAYLWLFVIMAILYLIGTVTKNASSADENIFDKPWKSPNNDELLTIGKLLVSKRITGCGEYHLKELGDDQYIIACTKDGTHWIYYVSQPNRKEISFLKNEIGERLNPPY